MSRFLYFLVIKPLSLMPLSLLYLLSDFLFFVMFHATSYRKAVVYTNLKNSFPDKSESEILKIQKDFFVHLCDVIVESVKLFSISKDELMRRFKITNTDVLNKYYHQGRSVILVGGHYNNWEIAAMSFNLYTKHQAIGIYTPLNNKFFDRKFGESRTRYGMEIIPKSLVPRSFVGNQSRLTVTVFGADQSPTYSKQVHWLTFLNQETAVHSGTERFSVKYNYPVVFFRLNKVKRGYYEGVYEVLHEQPGSTGHGEITALHTRRLEEVIKENPAYWLWSHKRWKRKKTEAERQEELAMNTVQKLAGL
ncbi:MAG: lysophospholipid acyltransferase family protein [Cyclobacteriaceae bacterium]|nr:lysophospholipid acyltransferase family protein [Cyclobacteriaceae bacterium]